MGLRLPLVVLLATVLTYGCATAQDVTTDHPAPPAPPVEKKTQSQPPTPVPPPSEAPAEKPETTASSPVPGINAGAQSVRPEDAGALAVKVGVSPVEKGAAGESASAAAGVQAGQPAQNVEQPPLAPDSPKALALRPIPDAVSERPQDTEAPLIPSVIDNADLICFYGHPYSRYMGILGEAPLPETAAKVEKVAAAYDAVNGERGTIAGFEIIYATANADATVGIINKERLQHYIDYADAHNMVVILDHQLGNLSVTDAVKSMLPYLRYKSVHLAIDPEWSTDKPGKVIGSVTAAQINKAQQLIQDYLVEHDISGKKLFVVHQFNWRMIQNRQDVRADFDRVSLIHNADGYGSPQDKYRSWNYNKAALNMPLKGFKLFYPKSWKDAGYDKPLLTPAEVMQLRPRPVLVMYQ